MPFVSNKRMNLAGIDYDKGEEVPVEVFNAMAPSRQGAMLRTRLIVEVEKTPEPLPEGDRCPHCGGGPYVRLAQHISLKHPDIDPEE